MRRHSRNPPLVLVIALSWLLVQNRHCSASEDASFRRPPPPPPPPGSSFSEVAERGTGNANNGENSVANGSADGYGYGYGQQQQYNQDEYPSSSYPSRYPDEYNNDNNNENDDRPQESGPQGGPPPPSTLERKQQQQQQNPSLPIHYEFPIASDDDIDTRGAGRRQRGRNDDARDGLEGNGMTSSARNDLVTRYWSTKRGKLQIQSVIGLIGYGSGSFVAKSFLGTSDIAQWSGYFWAAFLIISTWFRTPMGELSRAVGLSLILVLQRTQRIRREYPTWRYVAASVGILRGGPRDARGKPRGPRPFPPARNPWRYSPRSPRDPDFNMMYALVSMSLVGSTVGGNMPFIPNWIGALAGAAIFAFACTWQESHRGDLARTMGMRVVRAVTELWEIQADLQIIPKATVVSSQMIDRAMILDRKHRVKDRFLSLANKGYAQASKVAEQIQQQQRGGPNKDRDDDRRRESDSDDRRGGPRDADYRSRDRSRDEDRRRYRDDERGRSRGRREDDDEEEFRSRGRFRRRAEEDDREDDFGPGRRDDRRRGDGDYDNSRDGDYRRPEGRDEERKHETKSKGFFFSRN
mmetsp:Transcript_10529/g.24958  ORF Transcript_10529/g.24958 Transcript_10529/m.24958 type:complete len:579 (-) Transcript_10529:327-2063(-)